MLEVDVKLRLDRFDLTAALALDHPITAFFGPSGAGKSALLGVIAGTVNPQHGRVRLGGETLFDSTKGIRVPANRRRVGLVGRNPTVYPPCPIKTHLQEAFGQAPYRGDGFRFQRIVELLELGSVLPRHSRQLSATERRRVAVAHALMASPRLLLVDDDSTSLGRATRDETFSMLSRVRDSLRIPVIYVCQTLGEILQLTDQMVLMAGGRILGVGDVNQVIAERLLLASHSLQGIDNTLRVTICDHQVEDGCTIAQYYGTELVLPIAPHLQRNTTATVSVRSSDIALSKQYLTGISIQNQIKGRICAVIRTPEHAVVQVDCGNALLAGVSLKALRDLQLQEGDSIYCLIKAHAFRYAGAAGPSSADRPDLSDAPDDGVMPTRH